MKTKNVIYADNAATTRLDPLALEAMLPFLTDNFSNPSALHSFGKTVRKAVDTARQQIADCIGATPQEIFFTSCGTESDNWAIKGAARCLREKGSHLITSAIDHHAVLNSCAALEKEGFQTTLLPVDQHGFVSIDSLNAAVTPKTTFASIILANNEIGTKQDIPGLMAAAHQRGLLFHTDAVQALGHIPVNVVAWGVDLLSASAHKFNGPKGVGFLYKRAGVRLPPYLDGGHQEADNRAGTENVAGIIGMACALRNNHEHLTPNMEHLQRLEALFKARISMAIPDARFNGHPTQHLPGLISLSIPDISGESLLHLLDLKGILVSTGAACNSKDTVVSHVLQAINLPANYAAGTLRISLSKDNTPAEALAIAEAIITVAEKLGRKRF
jgi:cysteine desulfurase